MIKLMLWFFTIPWTPTPSPDVPEVWGPAVDRWQPVVEIALQASEKVIKRNLTDADNKKMIEKTVDEFKQAN